MARTKKEAPVEAEPEAQLVYQICATCRHWKVRPGWKHSGECMPSRAGGPSPIITTDWQGCGGWSPAG